MTGKMGRQYASDWYKEEKSNNLFYLSILKAWVKMIEHQTINIKVYGNMRKQSQPCWKQWGIQTGCDHMGQAGISRNGQVHSDRLSSSARPRWPVWEGEIGHKEPCSNMVSHNLHSCLCPGLSPSSQTLYPDPLGNTAKTSVLCNECLIPLILVFWIQPFGCCILPELNQIGIWAPGSDTTERFHFHFSLSCIGEGNGNPLQCSCLENPRDGGAWWAAGYGVAQSWTQLK